MQVRSDALWLRPLEPCWRRAVLCVALAAFASACDSQREAPDAHVASHAGRAAPPPEQPERSDAAPVSRDAGMPDASTLPDAGPGAASACAAGACNLRDAEGCGVTETCQLVGGGDDGGAPEPQCVPRGAGAEGDSCDASEDCDRGLDCTSYGDAGVCRRYCCELHASSECPPAQACKLALLDANDDPTGVALCDACDDCDPIHQTGCGGEQGCYVLPDSSGAACTLCLPSPGSGGPGADCDFADDCAPGGGCFRVNGGARGCAELCDTDEQSACGEAMQCVGLTLSDRPTLGLCVAP
jgi:hypothetical protein